MATPGAQAATYSFDSVNVPIYVPANCLFGVTWDLISLGYDSDNEQITSAESYFTVIDLAPGPFNPNNALGDGGNEQAVIKLDGNDFADIGNFVYSILGGSVNFSWVADGILEWKVTEASGLTGFILTDATLTVITGPKTQAVPDGGSMMALLGLSVLGLGWASRRVRA